MNEKLQARLVPLSKNQKIGGSRWPAGRQNLLDPFVAVAFLLAVPLAVAGGLGAAPLMTLLGIAALFIRFDIFLSMWRLSWLPFWAFLGFALVSFLWSPYERFNLPPKLLFMAVLFPPIILAIAKHPQTVLKLGRRALIAAVVGMAMLISMEVFFGYPLTEMSRGVAIEGDHINRNMPRGLVWLTMLLPAASLALFQEKFKGASILIALLWLTAFAISFQIGMHASSVALILAAIIMLLPASNHAGFTSSNLTLYAAAILVAPAWVLLSRYLVGQNIEMLPTGLKHRLHGWASLDNEIFSGQSIFGQGLDASRTYLERITLDGIDLQLMPLHPHNMPVQIWLELGLVGALLAALSLWLLSRNIGEKFLFTQHRRRAFNGLLAMMAPYCLISYGLWQEWWWGVVICAFASILTLATMHDGEKDP